MQATQSKSALQDGPFHETIVEALVTGSDDDFICLVMLVMRTKIPKNHDEIIRAIDERAKEMNLVTTLVSDAKEIILQKKAAAESLSK